MKFKDQLISPNLKYKLKHIVGLPKLPRVLKKFFKNIKKIKKPTLNNARSVTYLRANNGK